MATVKRRRREKGFYSTLHCVTTEDILPLPSKKARRTNRGRLWEVERLICRRNSSQGKFEYLVHWRGFSPYEASWQEEDDITRECVQLFDNPSPDENIVFSEVATFRAAVESHMLSKSRLPVTISFRGDVFRFLFNNKGDKDHGWLYLNRGDFPLKYFPSMWDRCTDSHGQGIKVFYPMKTRSFISWSPKKYCLGRDGKYIPCPRLFLERVTFSFVKVALGDENE